MQSKIIRVVVGVIINPQNEVLVALRAPHQEHGDLWEFPGGKVEINETFEQALRRELQEEIGITIEIAKPLTQIEYEYPNKKVLLDVWQVEKYSGEPYACADQTSLQWIPLHQLSKLNFPAANYSIIEIILRK